MLIGLLVVLLYPELARRWSEYNLRMLSSVGRQLVRLISINLGVAVLILIIEAIVVGYKSSSVYHFFRPDKSMISDICIFFFNILQIDYIILFFLTLGILHKMKIGIRTALELDQGLLADSAMSPAVQLVIYIIISDFVIYVQHYLHHRIAFLWNFHSYHHSATELNVLTAVRGHPVQAELTNGLIAIIPLTIMGFPLVSLMVYKVLRNIITFMGHSRLKWTWGWIGQYVFVSPWYHRIHHSVLPEHHDKNLAVLFPVWDHLFGTFYKGSVPAIDTGLPEYDYNKKSFLDDMIVPFRMIRDNFRKP